MSKAHAPAPRCTYERDGMRCGLIEGHVASHQVVLLALDGPWHEFKGDCLACGSFFLIKTGWKSKRPCEACGA